MSVSAARRVDELVQMAETLDVTIDSLLTGNGAEAKPLHNTRLLERFRALEAASREDRDTVIKLINALIVRHRVESAVRAVGRKKEG